MNTPISAPTRSFLQPLCVDVPVGGCSEDQVSRMFQGTWVYNRNADIERQFASHRLPACKAGKVNGYLIIGFRSLFDIATEYLGPIAPETTGESADEPKDVDQKVLHKILVKKAEAALRTHGAFGLQQVDKIAKKILEQPYKGDPLELLQGFGKNIFFATTSHDVQAIEIMFREGQVHVFARGLEDCSTFLPDGSKVYFLETS